MPRVMGLDLGKKRTGIAVTDPAQIIVTGLETQLSENLFAFLKDYFQREKVEKVIIGNPFEDNQFGSTEWKLWLDQWIIQFNSTFPGIKIDFQDERFTSLDARRILVQSGKSKKTRQTKGEVDKTSAILILQTYLGHI